MPAEYVWGLHNFIPEQDDEIDFRANERILVLERDEVYQDGWWKGTNHAGKTGLFPQGYTTSVPPHAAPSTITPSVSRIVSGSTLDALPEDDEPESSPDDATNGALLRAQNAAMLQQATPTIAIAGSPPNNDNAIHGAVMHATMTDIQEAIEQLGVRPDTDADALSRTFSFASTKEGITTDEDEGAGREREEHSPSWPKDARKILADKAAEQRADNAMPTSSYLQPPPIDVEMSDESEDEGEHNRTHPSLHIPIADSPPKLAVFPSVHSHYDSELSAAANGKGHARHASEATIASPTPRTLQSSETTVIDHTLPEFLVESAHELTDEPISIAAEKEVVKIPFPPSVLLPNSPSPPQQVSPGPIIATTAVPLSSDSAIATPPVPQTVMPTSPPWGRASVPTALVPTSPISAQSNSGVSSKPPIEWDVDEVVAWLRSKKFDEQICSKFIEHEISGDVLLELDQNMLKEVDITAFGKRVKIAHAIAELRRPPSVISSGSMNSPFTPYSQAYSFVGSADHGIYSPESPPHPGDLPGTPIHASLGEAAINVASNGKPRPVSLTLVANDANAQNSLVSPKSTSSTGDPGANQTTAGEVKKGFIHSQQGSISSLNSATTLNTASDIRRGSKDSTAATGSKLSFATATGKEKEKHKLASVKSSSSDGGNSRHSFFGSSLGGKSRKPAPRYSSETQETMEAATKPSRSLSRLYLSNSNSSKHRPRASGSTPPSSSALQVSDAQSTMSDVDISSPAQQRELSSAALPASSVTPSTPGDPLQLKPHVSVLDQIGSTDREGWMRKKGDKYNSWKLRYFVLKGSHLYYLRSKQETKIKGYINIKGYRIMADENANPGRYGFKIFHETGVTHWFSSDEQIIVREWMKALMKATIGRDYTKPVMSSVNIPTIPLHVAQAMSPAPRPPSPTARDATQRALRRDNPNQLSSRDARVLMGLTSDNANPNSASPTSGTTNGGYGDSRTTISAGRTSAASDTTVPGRPTRDLSRPETRRRNPSIDNAQDAELVAWINQRIPNSSQKATDMSASLATGLVLYRLSESIKTSSQGKPDGPEVPDSFFINSPTDDKLDGLFLLFDFFVDNDVRIGNVTINDVKNGDRDQLVALVKALKAWEDRRHSLENSLQRSTAAVGPSMARYQ